MTIDKYKSVEKDHYDSYFYEEKEYKYLTENEISSKDKVNIGARRYIEQRTSEVLKQIGHGKILDFGCSIGEKTYKFSSDKWEITGIDISSNSIKVANKLLKIHNLNAKFLVMDCENLTFSDNEFDIVYDFGTFSSLDVDKAINEICRVLKPDGYLFAIETLGNNPVFILKRKINVLLGSRTKWAVNHILRMKDWERVGKCFSNVEIKYFSLLTPYLSPFLRFVPESRHYQIIEIIEKIDSKLLKWEIFQKFAFKSVVILKNPIL